MKLSLSASKLYSRRLKVTTFLFKEYFSYLMNIVTLYFLLTVKFTD